MKKETRLVSLLILFALLLSGNTQAFADGSAPVAENLELRTYRNVSVGGKLCAFDPDEDVVSYSITTEPVKGSIELEENGCFVYTPKENKRGRDYFGYKAVDSEGNLSQEATVIIRIEKQKKPVMYCDLKETAFEYAATALSENDIFVGERIGGSYCFCPEQKVTRGEFLGMCLALDGARPMTAAVSSGYSDNEAMSAWMCASCAAARANGFAPDTDSFRADDFITACEAEAWLDRCLDLTEIRYQSPDPEHSQACLNLSAHGIPTSLSSHILTRAEAAEMLAAALEYRNQ